MPGDQPQATWATDSALHRPPAPDAYRGMSYEQASRHGLRLLEFAASTGLWRHLPEHLILLRAQMFPGEHAAALRYAAAGTGAWAMVAEGHGPA